MMFRKTVLFLTLTTCVPIVFSAYYSRNTSSTRYFYRKKYNFFTREQVEDMEALFQKQYFPTNKEKLSLSEKFGMKDRQIEMWFIERRRRAKMLKEGLIPPEQEKQRILELQHKTLLETAYLRNPFPDRDTKLNLSQALGIREQRVQTWFNNKRFRERMKDNPPVNEPQEREYTKFTKHQVDMMEAVFKEERYPKLDLKLKLCKDLGVPESRLDMWFSNRRRRERWIEEGLVAPESINTRLQALKHGRDLNEVYENTTFPSLELRKQLSRKLGIAAYKIEAWFRNKRCRERKRIFERMRKKLELEENLDRDII